MAKLQRKELTLFRAAEILNVTVTTLANYLSTMRQGDNPLTVEAATVSTIERSTFKIDGMSESEIEEESDEDSREIENIVTSNIQPPQNKSITFVSTSNLNGN